MNSHDYFNNLIIIRMAGCRRQHIVLVYQAAQALVVHSCSSLDAQDGNIGKVGDIAHILVGANIFTWQVCEQKFVSQLYFLFPSKVLKCLNITTRITSSWPKIDKLKIYIFLMLATSSLTSNCPPWYSKCINMSHLVF